MKNITIVLLSLVMSIFSFSAFSQNVSGTVGYRVGGPNGISSLNVKAQYDEWYATVKLPFFITVGSDVSSGLFTGIDVGKAFGQSQHKLYAEGGYMFKGYIFADLGYMWVPKDMPYNFKLGVGNYIYWPTLTAAFECRLYP